jgi:titin
VSLTDYVVQYSTDQTNWTTFSDGTSTTPSATVTGLTGGTNYYFRVAAVNSVGTGAYVTSTAIAPTSSKLTVARGNGSPSTFTGLGTAASPYTRAARVMNNNADGLMASGSGHTSGTYTFTATASGTAYVTCTFYDDNLDNNDGYIRKNGTAQGGAIPGDTTVTARSFSVVSGDVITFWSDSYLTSFSNVSVYAV